MSAGKMLFIGGTGILSREAGIRLVEDGAELTILNRGWSMRRQAPDGVEILHADVREPGALASAVAGRDFDVVVDFVAFSGEDVLRDIELFDGRAGQYVFISSVAAYDKPARHLPMRESTPLRNRFWSYGRGKIAGELALGEAYREHGFPATIVRPGHTYDRTHIPLNGEWTALDRMLRGRPVVVHGDGTGIWTLTHTRDFARAFVRLLGNPAAVGDSFHITSDERLTWDGIAQTLASALGVEPQISHVPSDAMAASSAEQGEALFGDRTYSSFFENAKIKEFVPGWTATTNFVEGAREIVEWYRSNPDRRRVDAELDAWFDALVARYPVRGD